MNPDVDVLLEHAPPDVKKQWITRLTWRLNFHRGQVAPKETHTGWVVQAGYDLTWFPPVDSSDSAFDPIARLDCVDSDYDFDECEAAREGRATPTAAGTYRRVRHSVTLALRYDWL